MSKRPMKNRLTHGQFYILTNWIRDNHAAGKWSTYVEAAAHASKELPFTIHPGTARDAMGVAGVKLVQAPIQVHKHNERRNLVRVLAAELINLMRALGHEPSADLLSIVHAKGAPKPQNGSASPVKP